MAGLTKDKGPPEKVRRVISTVIDNILDNLKTTGRDSISLSEIQQKHSKQVTQEHVERWVGGLMSHGIAELEHPANPLESPRLTLHHVPIIVGGAGQRRIVTEVLDSYELVLKSIPAFIEIVRTRKDFSPLYILHRPGIAPATTAVLDVIKLELARLPEMKTEEMIDTKRFYETEEKFTEGAREMIDTAFPGITREDRDFLADMLVMNMLGLGDIDLLMADNWIEDIAINNAVDPVYVYHRKYGWLKTNLVIGDEKRIREMCEGIGRRIGRQVSNLSPILDANLMTGDRVNATLANVSPNGNTITIRRFARVPWSVVDLVNVHNMSLEMAAFIWMAMQYEMNILVVGGTASGKTSTLNSLLSFIQPSHRIISIEDTKELNLASFAHWIPLVSKPPNPEGKGEIGMLDLMVNCLRMRPDRMVIGEIRTKDQTEVMFEAIHTGHSCYGTFHADNSGSAIRRLVEPPISVPPIELQGMHLIITQFRDRRFNRRRMSQIVEISPSMTKSGIELNLVYRWDSRTDEFERVNPSVRVFNELKESVGYTSKEIENNLNEKMLILSWLLKNKITATDSIASVISSYYRDSGRILELIKKGAPPRQVID